MDAARRRKKITKRLTKKLPRDRIQRSLLPQQRILDATFAVLDVETTGLGHNDQVVEIAIVRFTADGRAWDEWSTLVNPGRDLGSRWARSAHQLNRFASVAHAPTFEQIAGDVCARLTGCVVAAHNLQFDLRMLATECERVGIELPELAALCTLRVGMGLGVPERRLHQVCARFGIPTGVSHTALDDARACSRLLALYLMTCASQGLQTLPELGVEHPVPPPEAWRVPAPSGLSLNRTESELAELMGATRNAEDEYLPRLCGRLPMGENETEQEYLALLDTVLEDFEVTLAETAELHRFAGEMGLDAIRLRGLHQQYVSNLVEAAWADGVVSESERRQLALVAKLLDVDVRELDALIQLQAPESQNPRRADAGETTEAP